MGKKEKRLIESILFSASEPVSINEIKENTGFTRKKIKKTLKELTEGYNEKRKDQTAIEVVQAGDKYTMQVKEKYADKSIMIANPEIKDYLLKTLSLIAFHQPIKQSNLRRMIGSKAYEHVDELVSKRLVHSKKHKNTEMLTTTKKFPEYFGIESTDPEEIRDFLMKKVTDNIQEQEENN